MRVQALLVSAGVALEDFLKKEGIRQEELVLDVGFNLVTYFITHSVKFFFGRTIEAA